MMLQKNYCLFCSSNKRTRHLSISFLFLFLFLFLFFLYPNRPPFNFPFKLSSQNRYLYLSTLPNISSTSSIYFLWIHLSLSTVPSLDPSTWETTWRSRWTDRRHLRSNMSYNHPRSHLFRPYLPLVVLYPSTGLIFF